MIKNAFKVIFNNIIPDTHKPYINYVRQKRLIPKEEITEKFKRLKMTKKANDELSDKEKIFYGLLTTLDLDKEQRKMFKLKVKELENITDQYEL